MGLPVGIDELPDEPGFRPVVTYTLIAFNTMIYILLSVGYTLFGFRSYDAVLQTLGTYPADIVDPAYLYRVFTSMFLHADIIHLFGNMFFLYIFGRDVEKVMGPARFFVFYIIAGIIASVFNTLSIALLPATFLLSRPQMIYPWIIPSVGASGAISGVLGAYLILFPHARLIAVFYFFPIMMTAEFYIFIWFLYQLIMGLAYSAVVGIAFWAHIGGFIAGIALLPLFAKKSVIKLMQYRKQLLMYYGVY